MWGDTGPDLPPSVPSTTHASLKAGLEVMAQVWPRPLQPPETCPPTPGRVGQGQLSLSVPFSAITPKKEAMNSCLADLSVREGEGPHCLLRSRIPALHLTASHIQQALNK